MELYNSPYKTTLYFESESIIINRWTSTEMTDEIFQQEILVWVELLEKLKPSFMLANTQLFNFTISVEMQQWTNENVYPRIVEAGIRKFAVVVNSDLITQLAIEQSLEEENASAFHSRYFDNEEAAIEWFKK